MERTSKDEEKLLLKALPLEERVQVQEGYVIEEGYQDAVQYLLQVRNETEQTNQVIKSKQYESYKRGIDKTGRDYLEQSLSRLIFTANEDFSQEAIYQDQDIVMSRVSKNKEQQHWDKNWLKEVLSQRQIMREEILRIQRQMEPEDKIMNAAKYFKYQQAKIGKHEIPTEVDIAKASEIVLQEIFGQIVIDKEDIWDQLSSIPEIDLLWIYGLLCILEKPLLPDQAGDLNLLLNVLLKCRQSLDTNSDRQRATLDINIAIITEYFEQRFK